MIEENKRYDKTSGCGENPQLEKDVIKDFFGDRLVSLEEIKDKERQVKGIDYIVSFKNWKGEIITENIDCKMHLYDSDFFVFEYDDDRPNYHNRTWGSAEKETDLLFYIWPAKNKYGVYSEASIKEFRNSDKWLWHNHEEFMDAKHFVGKYPNKKYVGRTYNKYLPPNFTVEIGKRSCIRNFEMSGYGCQIKPSYYYFDELTKTFRRK